MPHNEAHEISRRWIAKGDRCNRATVDAAFDRFFSYFVAYNALYFIAAAKARSNSEDAKARQGGDMSASTKGVPNYLGADRLWAKLEETCKPSIEALREGLLNSRFSVSTDRTTGEVDPEHDKELASKIANADPAIRCTALLTVIYYVRCNMFHSGKLPTHIQKEPLDHVSLVLRQTATYLSSRLDAA